MIVYVITNLINGKRYIGITEMALQKRWSAHKWGANSGSKTALHCAIRKYGSNNFKVAPIVSALPGSTRGDLCYLERLLISQENTMGPIGYNLTPGDGVPAGTPNHNKGKPLSEEHREKLRQAWARSPSRKLAMVERNQSQKQIEAARRGNSDPGFRARLAVILRARNAVMNQSEDHKAKLKAAWDRDPQRHINASITMSRTMNALKQQRSLCDGR